MGDVLPCGELCLRCACNCPTVSGSARERSSLPAAPVIGGPLLIASTRLRVPACITGQRRSKASCAPIRRLPWSGRQFSRSGSGLSRKPERKGLDAAARKRSRRLDVTLLSRSDRRAHQYRSAEARVRSAVSKAVMASWKRCAGVSAPTAKRCGGRFATCFCSSAPSRIWIGLPALASHWMLRGLCWRRCRSRSPSAGNQQAGRLRHWRCPLEIHQAGCGGCWRGRTGRCGVASSFSVIQSVPAPRLLGPARNVCSSRGPSPTALMIFERDSSVRPIGEQAQ